MTQTVKHMLFGTRNGTLQAMRDRLSGALGLDFHLRESSYLGGDYFLARDADPFAARLKLHSNRDLWDGSDIFSQLDGVVLVVQAEDVRDAAGLKEQLGNLGFIVLAGQ